MAIPLGAWSGSDATRELHVTIKEFTRAAEKSARTMNRLTWVMTALTFLMFVGLCVQIWLTVYPIK